MTRFGGGAVRSIGRAMMWMGLAAASWASATTIDRSPVPTRSWYARSTEPSLFVSAGCNTGRIVRDAPATQRLAVILIFGGFAPSEGDAWAFDLYSGAAASEKAVANAISAYIDGYASCAGPQTEPRLTIVVGTTTSLGVVSRDAGAAFARVIDGIDRSVGARNPGVTLLAGNDIELGYVSPSSARAWVDGFHQSTERWLVNYGDLAGCPGDRIPHRGDCGSAAFPEWGIEDVWHVTGHPKTINFPTIYVTTGIQARQWRNVSRYGLLRHGRPLKFMGALSQMAACQERPCSRWTRNPPGTAWHQLRSVLAAEPSLGSTDLALSDIGWMEAETPPAAP